MEMNLGLRNLALVLLCTHTLGGLAGCGPGDGGSSGNTDQTTDDGQAEVSFPSVIVGSNGGGDSKLIAISDDGGISGSFFGDTDDADSFATITRFEGTTEADSFVASIDSEFRTDRVTIGDTEVDFTYAEDGTFIYSVNRGDETLFDGSGLSITRATVGLGGGLGRRTDPADLIECRDNLIITLADFTEQLVGDGPGSVASPEFISCLQDVAAVRRVGSVICTSTLVIIPALVDALTECNFPGSQLRCLTRAGSALSTVAFFVGIMEIVLIDMISQIRQDGELCAAGGP